MTLRERLQQRISLEQQEIARIKSDAIANAQAATDRITLLRAALAMLTAEAEDVLTKLAAIGVKVVE